MTREEAIDFLLKFRKDRNGELREVVNMAIKALQTPPISQRSMYQAGYRQAQEDRPKGKWVEKEVVQDEKAKVIEEWQSARCSNCGRYHTTPYHYYFYEDNFCPYCGADMRGEDE